MKLEQGNKYQIELEEEKLEGTFVNETQTEIFLKLKSGYNIGIEKTKIKNSKLLEQKKEIIKEKTKHDPKKGLPKIMILHTGGTIASRVDYATGAVTAKFTPDEIIGLFPELGTFANIESELISNMPSDDMNFSHYNMIGRAIENALKEEDLKGIILTQGTDTLHYTASALSFMLEHIDIPVLIVGSQRSSDRPSSDAATNLINAAYFITQAEKNKFSGVAICMHQSTNDPDSNILAGTNARKMHSSRRDAFKSINSKFLAKVNYETKKIIIEDKNDLKKYYFNKEQKKFSLKSFDENIKIGIIRSRPGLRHEEIKIYENFDGIILEGTGLGHFPIETFDKSTEQNKEILETIKKIAKQHIAVMTTQCINGRVNLNVYSPGRLLKDNGVLGHNIDMITETAYIKLAWLLSNYDKEKAKKLYSSNLRGEISERLEEE
jgi:glutamyl-tRNA(Gln) amidotransferase subunit D